MITRRTVAEKLSAYLRHEIALPDLVRWAETAMSEGEFEEKDLDAVRDVVSRLGVADVRAFGLMGGLQRCCRASGLPSIWRSSRPRHSSARAERAAGNE